MYLIYVCKLAYGIFYFARIGGVVYVVDFLVIAGVGDVFRESWRVGICVVVVIVVGVLYRG